MWDSDVFHQKVMDLEAQGYAARRDTYRITAEMNPETGIVLHHQGVEPPAIMNAELIAELERRGL
jgi:hypothetical protein